MALLSPGSGRMGSGGGRLLWSARQEGSLDMTQSLFQGERSRSVFAEALACRCCFLWGSEPSGFLKKSVPERLCAVEQIPSDCRGRRIAFPLVH